MTWRWSSKSNLPNVATRRGQQHRRNESITPCTRKSPAVRSLRMIGILFPLCALLLHPSFRSGNDSEAKAHGDNTSWWSTTTTKDTIHRNTAADIEAPTDLESDSLHSIPGCLTQACIRQVALGMARAWPERTERSTWCRPATVPNNPQASRPASPLDGIILTKVPKGASSTAAGIVIRLARRNACGSVTWKHQLACNFTTVDDEKEESDPSSKTTFLLSTVRDPAKRAVSTVFFHVLSRLNTTGSSTSTEVVEKREQSLLLQHLKRSTHQHLGAVSLGQGGFQLRYLSRTPLTAHAHWTGDQPTLVVEPDTLAEEVRTVLNSYDFLLVPERMDESVTALALTMGVDVGDVLVTASKVAGSRYHLLHPKRNKFECISPKQSVTGDVVESFLKSEQWFAMNYGDYLLHEAASASLDATIQTLGKERFDKALARYRNLRKLELQTCADSVQFPCSNDGEPQMDVARQNCYLLYYDFGCGYPCIDDMIKEYDGARTIS